MFFYGAVCRTEESEHLGVLLEGFVLYASAYAMHLCAVKHVAVGIRAGIVHVIGVLGKQSHGAEAYHIPTTIVFNKCDLYDDEQMAAAEGLISVFENIGYHSFMISAKTGFQCDELKEIMKDKVSLFSGHSGVGKSALINRLDPNLNVRVGEISDVHEKGKHTTTFCQLPAN